MRRMVYFACLAVFVLGSIFICSGDLPVSEEQWGGEAVSQLTRTLSRMSEEELEFQRNLARWYNLNLTADWKDRNYRTAYSDLLAASGTAMAYLTVPSQAGCIPICRGSQQEGKLAHLADSAIPVGGNGTHCVLIGNVNLATGDRFCIHILREVRTFHVDLIETATSSRAAFPVEQGRELCTIVSIQPGAKTETLRLIRCSLMEEHEEQSGEIIPVLPHKPDGWYFSACTMVFLGVVLVPFTYKIYRKEPC